MTWGSPRPLEPGQHAVTATFGGPITNVPNIGTIPLPNLTIEGRHGMEHHLDVSYGLHLLPLAFGVAGAHLGGSWQLFDQPNSLVPALTLAEKMFVFTNAIDARKTKAATYMLSETDLLASWEFFDQLGWLGLAAYFPFNEPQLHVAPVAGVEIHPGLDWLRIGFEARWLNPAVNQTYAVVDWVSPGDQGAIQVTGGLAFVFGGAR